VEFISRVNVGECIDGYDLGLTLRTNTITIIGAGPYGLSIAATLRNRGVPHRIFGAPMHSWAEHMPRGMHLKSEAFASSLYDPRHEFTLKAFCLAQGLPYQDIGFPVPLAKFVEYGKAFQRELVPHLEPVDVAALAQSDKGYVLTLEGGEQLTAEIVILATGIRHFQYVPAGLETLGPQFLSHTYDHAALDKFAGQSLAVIGGGASALGFAALAADAGAFPEVFVRDSSVNIHEPPDLERPLLERIRAPWTGLGPSWRSWLCVHLPLVFWSLPEALRLEIARRHLGPSGNWTVKKTVEEKVPVHCGKRLERAEIVKGKLHLHFAGLSGKTAHVADHLVAGTGYRADVDRLTFIDASLRRRIARQANGAPALNSHFEASVPGLYFAGPASASSFGPMFRFVYGAEFASKRIASRVCAVVARQRRSVRASQLKPVID
jgi:thioredoxin reductase